MYNTAAYVMSTSVTSGKQARLASPPYTVQSLANCLSFYVYFNSPSVSLTVTAAKPDAIRQQHNLTVLGILEYPYLPSMFSNGENMQLLRVRVPLPVGTYRIIFAADGSGGSVAVWDLQQETGPCQSRK
jgi:hypothetical protein